MRIKQCYKWLLRIPKESLWELYWSLRPINYSYLLEIRKTPNSKIFLQKIYISNKNLSVRVSSGLAISPFL